MSSEVRAVRAAFALVDGLFVAAIVVLSTTITPLFSPATSFIGLAMLLGAAVCAIVVQFVFRRETSEDAASRRGGGRAAIARWVLELVCIALALALILNGGPIGWVAAGAGVVGAVVSLRTSAGRASVNTKESEE